MHLTKRHNIFEIGPNKYILANGMTGEILVVNQAVARTLEALRAQDVAACDPQVLRELEARGFVFASEADDDAAFAAACQPGWEAFRDTIPREYTFAVNAHCNFNCPYCFESEALRARRNTLSEEQVAIGTYNPELVLDPEKTAMWTDQTIMNRKGCHECPISTYCGGGCMMGSLMHYGNTDTPFCEEGPQLVQLYFDEIRQAHQGRSGLDQ
jgi:radical SAM protein with 4Fe4S-binding SPASM domain